jgi:hypothetical protein
MAKKRILLVHLIANGDCLMATTVARQIKVDFPGSHLTWAIGFKCRHVIDNNPDVDEVWSVDYAPHELPHDDVWRKTKQEAERRKAAGEFDRVYYTQIFPENFNNFDGTTRTTIFRSYPGKITVPIAPVIRLHEHEVERVKRFAASNDLQRYQNVVIFECAPGSLQSPLTPEMALGVARRIVQRRSDTTFIISSHHKFESGHSAIIDGSVLSYRENAELSKYGTLLLGGSSGITWLMTSDWAKRLPTIQFLQKSHAWYSFASVKYDHQFFGLDAGHILETDLREEGEIADLVGRYLDQKTFDGLAERVFRPSIDQIHGLYDMAPDRLEVGRVLRIFMERNREADVDVAAFYRSIVRRRLQRKARGVVRRVKVQLRRALSWATSGSSERLWLK